MALTQISTDGIKDGTITGSDLATNVDLVDNKKIRFGTGNDLEIFHNGSNSFIKDTGTGNLVISGSQVSLESSNLAEFMVKAIENAQVELYHNGSKKFETTSGGVQVTDNLNMSGGHIFLADSYKLNVGTGDDLQIYHDGSHSYIQDSGTGDLTLIASRTIIGSSNNAEVCAAFIENGAVELYHDNSKKFETHSAGVLVSGNVYLNDNNKFIAGTSNDLQIYHDGSHSYIQNSTGSLQVLDGSTEKFRVSGTGTFFKDDIHLSDSDKINLGASNDLQIYHDGSDSFIKDTGTGGIRIDSSQFIVRNAAGSSPNMEIKDDGRTFIPSAYNETTSGSVNLRVLSDGQLKRSTSSIRYKKDVTDATWGLTEVLKLKPKTFKNNATGEDADDKTYGGFTAEDIHDLGLTEFVDYNEKNEPDALAYGNMVALMAKAIQDLNVKLETEVAALKAS